MSGCRGEPRSANRKGQGGCALRPYAAADRLRVGTANLVVVSSVATDPAPVVTKQQVPKDVDRSAQAAI